MAKIDIKKAYRHKEAGQIYRATLEDGSIVDVEASSLEDATRKIDEFMKSLSPSSNEAGQTA